MQVKLKEDDIKGISLRNLPKYLKDKGITISKEDHVVINLKSDSDSSICGDNQTDGEKEGPSSTNEQSSRSNETRTGNIAVIEAENRLASASVPSSENNTLDSQKSSGSSEVYVKNTQASVHSSPTSYTENTGKAPEPTDYDSSPSSSGQEENVIATRIEIRTNSSNGVDNVAFQNSKTDPV